MSGGTWERYVDDATDTPYYYNADTGETSWDQPEGYTASDAAVVDGDDQEQSNGNQEATTESLSQPPRWKRFMDESSGEYYFHDVVNDRTQWDEPEGFVDDASEDEREQDGHSEGDGHDGGATGSDAEGDEQAGGLEKDLEHDDGQELAVDITVENEEHGDGDAGKAKESHDAISDASESATVPGEVSAAESVLAHGPSKDSIDARKSKPSEKSKWVKHMDQASGKPYYHDEVSGRTQWERPASFVETTQKPVMTAEYLEYLHRSRAERLARVTQKTLDPEGHLSRLNALLSKIDDKSAAAAGEVPEDIHESVKARATAEWQQHVDPSSQRYYYHNIATGATQWEKPDGAVASALGDWVPPETPESAGPRTHARTVSGINYAATAKFNRVTGKYEQHGADQHWQSMGVAPDREGRQMSHFFDMSQMEKNRADAKLLKESLKRKNIDWKKVAAEKKAKKQKQKTQWLYQD